MVKPSLLLYIGQGCPYCSRVTDFLAQNPMTITVKDVWSDPIAMLEMQKLSGGTQVPCLKITDDYMLESLDIIEKLKEIQAHTK